MDAKTAYIDFKDGFDIDSEKDWCDIVKNSVAMANSGGGIILIGAGDDGVPSGSDVTPVLDIDPAVLADMIAAYTGERFSGFKIAELDKEGVKIAALLIESVSIPMVFIKPVWVMRVRGMGCNRRRLKVVLCISGTVRGASREIPAI